MKYINDKDLASLIINWYVTNLLGKYTKNNCLSASRVRSSSLSSEQFVTYLWLLCCKLVWFQCCKGISPKSPDVKCPWLELAYVSVAMPESVSWCRGADCWGITTRRFLFIVSGEAADLFRDCGDGETDGEGAAWYPLLATSSISWEGGLGDRDCCGEVSRDSL